jgi:hypothetical protein
MKGYKKGQVTLVNLIALVVTVFVYAVLAPVLQPQLDTCIAALSVTPNAMTPAIVVLIQLTPFFLLLMIVLTGFNWAMPRQQQGYG